MRNLSLLFLLILPLISFVSCKEDVDLIGDYKETAVIYGLLNQNDTLHYIKITKAFLTQGNAYDAATIAENSYFDQVEGTISEYINGTKTREWDLRDTLVSNKDTNGAFYGPEQKLYYFSSANLNTNATYKLAVSFDNGTFEVTGETKLVSGVSTTADVTSYQFEFIDSYGNYKNKSISVNPGTAYIANLTIDVNYKEYTATDTLMKSFSWTVGESETNPGTSSAFTLYGETFYDLVKAKIEENPDVIKRNVYAFNVKVTAGTQDLYNYILVNEPSTSLAQTKPTFTNLTATNDKNVIGIFAGRLIQTVQRPYINPALPNQRMLSSYSTKELCIGAITGDLLFCSQHIQDSIIGANYYCH